MGIAPEFGCPFKEGDIAFVKVSGVELEDLTDDKYYQQRVEKAKKEEKTPPPAVGINFSFVLAKGGNSVNQKFYGTTSIFIPAPGKDFDGKSKTGKVLKALNKTEEVQKAFKEKRFDVLYKDQDVEYPGWLIEEKEDLEILKEAILGEWCKCTVALTERDGKTYASIDSLVKMSADDKEAFTKTLDALNKKQAEEAKANEENPDDTEERDF